MLARRFCARKSTPSNCFFFCSSSCIYFSSRLLNFLYKNTFLHSGESGAGKTVNAKRIIQYIATVGAGGRSASMCITPAEGALVGGRRSSLRRSSVVKVVRSRANSRRQSSLGVISEDIGEAGSLRVGGNGGDDDDDDDDGNGAAGDSDEGAGFDGAFPSRSASTSPHSASRRSSSRAAAKRADSIAAARKFQEMAKQRPSRRTQSIGASLLLQGAPSSMVRCCAVGNAHRIFLFLFLLFDVLVCAIGRVHIYFYSHLFF